MPFLTPNQQQQSTEGTNIPNTEKTKNIATTNTSCRLQRLLLSEHLCVCREFQWEHLHLFQGPADASNNILTICNTYSLANHWQVITLMVASGCITATTTHPLLHSSYTLEWAGKYRCSKVLLPTWRSGPPSSTWFLAPTQGWPVCTLPNTQTDHATGNHE